MNRSKQTDHRCVADTGVARARRGWVRKAARLLASSAMAALLLLAWPNASPAQSAAARAPVGSVLSAQGTVTLMAPTGAARIAVPDSPVLSGDQVATQAGSEVVLAYADGTRVLLGANSSLQVPQLAADAGPAGPSGSFAAITQLLRGAARFISGVRPGRGLQSGGLQVKVATATIGVRGTDFTVRLCEGDCRVAADATVARASSGELAGRVAAAGGGLSALDAQGRWRVLGPDAALREGDVVLTGSTGVGVLVLRDGTAIALDPGARLWIAEMRWDEARPSAGRIRLQLLDGQAQVASGALAKARPERFDLMAGAQPVRMLGTVVALKPALPSAPNNPALALPLYQVDVQGGAVELPAAQGPGQRLVTGQAGGPDALGRVQLQAPLALAQQAPDLARLTLEPGVLQRLFGAAAATPGQPAAEGVYVHVRDGAVELEQAGRSVLLGQGETALAPKGGGAPVKIDRGVLVAGNATLGLDRPIAAQSAVCTVDPPSLGPGLRPPVTRTVTAADADIADVRSRIQGRLRQDALQGIDTSSNFGGGNRFGLGFEKPQGSQSLGEGGRSGAEAATFEKPTNVGPNLAGRITGWAAGSFHGERHNANAGPLQLMGGMIGSSLDRVSAGRVSGGSVQAGSGGFYGSDEYENTMATYGQEAEVKEAVGTQIAESGIKTTGDWATDVAELVYFMTVGSSGYEATRNMSSEQRQAYWAGQAQAQRTGAGRPREDENFTAGGSGLPIYIRAGQYGNEVRALERAIGARINAAGGGRGDGRGDRDTARGSTGGRALTRGEQLGAGVGQERVSGGVNWSAAFPQNIDGPRQ